MPAKLERCVKKVQEQGWPKDRAYAICNASINDTGATFAFNDSMTFDEVTKKCISVRDGYQEYYGSELGIEPSSRLFKVYRSPETIREVSTQMEGLPLTVGHVRLSDEPPAPSGSVKTSSVVNFLDESTKTTVAIENDLELEEAVGDIAHKEFSLGYFADLVPHDGEFDFEQVGIVPHHLALVANGRCGPICSFSDSEKTTTKEDTHMEKLFYDQEGELNMQQIVEAVTALPEIIKTVPLDKLQEIMPAVNELVAAANAAGVEVETGIEKEMEPEMGQEEMTDMEEEKIPMEDSAQFKDAVRVATMDAVKRHGEVIEKAKNFLDEDYAFTGKTTCQVMRDALATQHGKQEFGDEELSIAFKMLKKTADYTNFTDSKVGSLESLKDKEL